MNDSNTEPTSDHDSDPARNDELGQDWSDEGGASTEGPATHIESGHSSDDPEQ